MFDLGNENSLLLKKFKTTLLLIMKLNALSSNITFHMNTFIISPREIYGIFDFTESFKTETQRVTLQNLWMRAVFHDTVIISLFYQKNNNIS